MAILIPYGFRLDTSVPMELFGTALVVVNASGKRPVGTQKRGGERRVTPELKELVDRLACGLWAADYRQGAIATKWSDLGEIGQRSYVKDAAALVMVLPEVGLHLTLAPLEAA